MREAYYRTIRQLADEGDGPLPEEMQSSAQLIYSSPATLAFNSPGAQGYGVKRAGLAIPGSVMLLVAPGCCGRNTKLLAEVPGYEDRFFFLLMDESDIVNGNHLAKVSQAVCEILDFLEERPSCVMICSTCVDALLGTDWERVCRRAEEAAGLPVRPCYMYALTREGRKPPMVLVRQAIYSLLEPAERHARTVNLIGNFSALIDDCELYDILRQMGIRTINEIARCEDFAAYQAMAHANFNVVLDPEARLAADDMEKRLGMPYLELTRLYQADKIHRQYHSLAAALGSTIDDEAAYGACRECAAALLQHCGSLRLCIGEMMHADPFELALAMIGYGHRVEEIYALPSAADRAYIRRLAEVSPATRVYTNLSPTMIHYDSGSAAADLTIGMDAAYYHPAAPNVPWNEERQPFGYAGVIRLMNAMEQAWEEAYESE